MWRIDRKKQKENKNKNKMFALRIVNDEEVTRKVKISLRRFVCTDFLAPNTPSLVIRMSFILLVLGG